MKNKILSISKIFIALIVGFFIAGLANHEIFIANSPTIRPHVGTYILVRIKGAITNNTLIANLFNTREKQTMKAVASLENALKDSPLKQITKGIYAKSNDEYSYVVIKQEEIEWLEYTYEIKGKQIKIKVPKGEEPLPKEILEKTLD